MLFTVATWNIGGLMTGAAYKRDKQTRRNIGLEIGSWIHDVDVVLLQEVDEYKPPGFFQSTEHDIEFIRARSRHAHFRRFPTVPFTRGLNGKGMAGVAVLSRHPIGHAELVKAAHVGWPLSMLYARIPIGKRVVHFFGGHYPHDFHNKVIVSTTIVERATPLRNEPLVMGADFNGGPPSREVGIITGGNGTGIMRLAAIYDSIDHILVRNVNVHSTSLRHPGNNGPGYLTDHPLVGAVLDL